MANDLNAKLLDAGFDLQQIIQILKMEKMSIPAEMILEENNLNFLLGCASSTLREFNESISSIENKTIKKHHFKYFCQEIDTSPVLKQQYSTKQATILFQAISEKAINSETYDLSPIFNKNFSERKMRILLKDIKAGIDVTKYCDLDISDDKTEMISTGFKKFNTDFTRYIKKFDFISSVSSLEDLKNIIEKNAECDDILEITRSTKNTLLYYNYLSQGCDLLPVLSRNISENSMQNYFLCATAHNVDLNDFKHVGNISVDKILAINKLKKYNVDFVALKNHTEKELSLLYKAYEYNETVTDKKLKINIKDLSHQKIYDAYVDCYIYGQSEYFEDIKSALMFYTDKKTSEDLDDIIKYNYEHPDNIIDIGSLIYNQETLNMESKEILQTYCDYILSQDIDQNLIDKLKACNFGKKSLNCILETYAKGYDISMMLYKELTYEHLKAIQTCLELGLKIEKEHEYNITTPKTTNRKDVDEYDCSVFKKALKWSNSYFDSYFDIEF